MRKIIFTEDVEQDILNRYNAKEKCIDIAKLYDVNYKVIIRLLKNKFSIDLMKHPEVGDVIKGWKIKEIFQINSGTQNIKMATIESTLELWPMIKNVRLTNLTNKNIGWPDLRRKDNIARNTTHDMTQSRIFKIWSGMKNRCSNKNELSRYKILNISICDDWLDFNNFKSWAENHGYEEHLTLDRIDNTKNYCPENCRWATMYEQAANKSNSLKIEITAWGETKGIYEWLHDERCSVTIHALKYRIGSKWNPEEAISMPPSRRRKLKFEEWAKRNHPEIHEEYLNNYHNV